MARLPGPLDIDDIFLIQTDGIDADGNPTGEWRHVAGAGAGAVPLGSFGERGPTGPAFDSYRSPHEIGLVSGGGEPQLIFGDYRARRAIVMPRDPALDNLPGSRPVYSCYVLGSRTGEQQLPTDDAGVFNFDILRRRVQETLDANPLTDVGVTGHVRFPAIVDTSWPRPAEDHYTNTAAMLRTEMAKWSYDKTPPSFVAVVRPNGTMVACDPSAPHDALRTGAQHIREALGDYSRQPTRLNERQLNSPELLTSAFGLTQVGTHSLLYVRDPETDTTLVIGNLADVQRGFSNFEAGLAGSAVRTIQSFRHDHTGLAMDRAPNRMGALAYLKQEGPVSIVELSTVDIRPGDQPGRSDDPEGLLRFAQVVERAAAREPERLATVHPESDSLGGRILVYLAGDATQAAAFENRLRGGIEEALDARDAGQIRFVSGALTLAPEDGFRTIGDKLAKLDSLIDDKVKLVRKGIKIEEPPAPFTPTPALPSRATRRPPARRRRQGPGKQG